jgi:hypothetical protein
MATKPLQPSSTIDNPQQMFESALSLMQPDHSRRRRNSIEGRTQPIALVQSDKQIEKRALTDAARALARLWHVSPNLVR